MKRKGSGGKKERRKEERKKDFDRTTKSSFGLCGKQRIKKPREKGRRNEQTQVHPPREIGLKG